MFTLKTYLQGHRLYLCETPALASGSVAFDRVHFDFDESWDGLPTRVALFWPAEGGDPYGVAVDASGDAKVPYEVLEDTGRIQFGVYGASGSGDDAVRAVSTRICYKIVSGAWSDDMANPGSPTPSLIDQFRQAAEEAMARAQAVTDAAVTNFATEFVATKPYVAGEYVTHDGTLYRFTADHPAGAWTGTDAVKAPVGGELTADSAALAYTRQDLAAWGGINIFNPYALIEKTGLDVATGEPIQSDLYDVTDFIDVQGYTALTFKLFDYEHAPSFAIFFYDDGKGYMSRKGNGNYQPGRTVTFATDGTRTTRYIRIRVERQDNSSGSINPYRVMVVLGEQTITDFVPYYTANDKTARAAIEAVGAAKADLSGVTYNFNRTDIPADADSVATNSIYYIQVNDVITGLPDDVSGNYQAGWLVTVVRSSNTALQFFVPLTPVGIVYQRIKSSSAWGNWQTGSFVGRDSIAELYTNSAYDMRDIRFFASALYRANQYIPTAESFNSAKWDKFVVADEIQNIEQNAYNTSCLSMFTDIAAVGDSFTAGYLYNKAGDYYDEHYVPDGTYRAISWPSVMSRLYGINVASYSKAGATTRSFVEELLDGMIADEPKQLYILALGLNDHSHRPKGSKTPIIPMVRENYTPQDDMAVEATTVADIPDSTYGYYSYIIRKIKDMKNRTATGREPKIVLVKSLWVLNQADHKTSPYGVNGYYKDISEFVENLSNYFGIPYIETLGDPYICGKAYVDDMKGLHPTAPLYAGLARRLGQLIDKCIIDNPSYFFDFYIPNN